MQQQASILENVLLGRLNDEIQRSIQLESLLMEQQEENKQLKEDLKRLESTHE